MTTPHLQVSPPWPDGPYDAPENPRECADRKYSNDGACLNREDKGKTQENRSLFKNPVFGLVEITQVYSNVIIDNGQKRDFWSCPWHRFSGPVTPLLGYY